MKNAGGRNRRYLGRRQCSIKIFQPSGAAGSDHRRPHRPGDFIQIIKVIAVERAFLIDAGQQYFTGAERHTAFDMVQWIQPCIVSPRINPDRPLASLIAEIDAARAGKSGLSSALRLYVLRQLKK